MDLPTLKHHDVEILAIWCDRTHLDPDLYKIAYSQDQPRNAEWHKPVDVLHNLSHEDARAITMALRRRIYAVRRLVGRDVSSLVIT